MFRAKTMIIALAAALSVVTVTPAQSDMESVTGVWRSENQSHVTIKTCAEGHCGYLSKVVVPPKIYSKYKEDIDKLGGAENLIDYFNKDDSLKMRRLKGVQVLTLDSQKSANVYQGAVYNPEDGNTYSGTLELVSQDKLILKGCVLFDLLCRSEEWVRVQ